MGLKFVGMSESVDGARWWDKLLGLKPKLTEGERRQIAPGSDADKYLAAQEVTDARRLIRTGDPEAVEIGQARLRVALSRETDADLDLFSHKG